jgi:ribosomal-protein-alanine N-acetyltransferase
MVEPSVARPRSGHVQRLACVAMARGKLIGFAAGRVVVGEGEIENIAVAADYRRQGVAAALVAALLASCRRAGATVVRLEVRASNAAAHALYQTAGFQVENSRKLYYQSPTEDALVMVKHLASAR